MKKAIAVAFVLVLFMSCAKKEEKTFGNIERIDPALDAIVNNDAKVEIIAEGFEWSEGPLWLSDQNMLIFSDVPKNIVYKWSEGKDAEVYLTPSGYTGDNSPYSGEEGSNGLFLSNDGKLVLCQHGDRKVSVMDAPLNAPAAKFLPLADNYQGKKLNSPNDGTFNSKGDLFFTDPPYGLPKQAEDSTKEIPFQGVYRVSNGQIVLLTDSVTRPNGIALFPGEKTLIVANSDPAKAVWYAFDLAENDSIASGRVFYDATQNTNEKGLPDGLKIDKAGNVFATGPGGVWIFSREGKLLGKIKIPEATSNCALSPDEKTLFITADMYVVRVKLRS
ncbi:MAG TPA: SMP-30/gluconolactonase/LRE family protein [Chryseolinea sp.]